MMRFLIIFGIALVVLILLWPYLSRLGLGRPTGGVVVERPSGTFYALVVTGLILSVVLSALLWWFGR